MSNSKLSQLPEPASILTLYIQMHLTLDYNWMQGGKKVQLL